MDSDWSYKNMTFKTKDSQWKGVIGEYCEIRLVKQQRTSMAKAFCKYLEHNISSIYFSYNLQYSDCANPVGIIAETVNKHLCKNYIRNSDTNTKKH